MKKRLRNSEQVKDEEKGDRKTVQDQTTTNIIRFSGV